MSKRVTTSNLEQLLLKGDQGNENNELFTLYKDDFTRDVLQVQLSTLHVNYSIKNETGIHGIIEVIKNMSAAERSLFSEVVKVIRIVLVAPATNSISERSFSAMRRIKTYLRSTMKQERLNAVMIMNVHHHLTDTLDLKSITNDFRLKNEHRKNKFPTF